MLATSTTNESAPRPEPLDGAVDEPPRVLHPARGERREVGVLGERLLGRDQRRQLSQQAALAHPHVQRVGRSPAARAPRRAGTARTAAWPRGPGSCAAALDPHSRQVSAGSVAVAAARGAVSVSIRGLLRSGRPPPRARLSARRGVFHARHRSAGRRAVPVECRVSDAEAARTTSGGAVGPWRPVRRGVTAAPRILVPMVQVRILAAERQVRAGAHDHGTRLDSSGMEPRSLTRSWERLCKRLQIRAVPLHALRHTCVSLLLALGHTGRSSRSPVGVVRGAAPPRGDVCGAPCRTAVAAVAVLAHRHVDHSLQRSLYAVLRMAAPRPGEVQPRRADVRSVGQAGVVSPTA